MEINSFYFIIGYFLKKKKNELGSNSRIPLQNSSPALQDRSPSSPQAQDPPPVEPPEPRTDKQVQINSTEPRTDEQVHINPPEPRTDEQAQINPPKRVRK